MDQPKVSVIVPMYNTKEFIETCIGSLLQQTLKEIEVVVVDDCSTDGSFEFVRSMYCEESSPSFDARVKLFRNVRNSGVGQTRNFGIEVSTGKYIQFVDSDDAILVNTLETLFNQAEEADLDVLYVNSILIAKDYDFTLQSKLLVSKTFCLRPTLRQISSNLNERLMMEFLGSGLWWMPVVKLTRRELLIKNKILFPNMFSGEDMMLQLATLFFLRKAALVEGGFYIYRYRAESITHTSNEKYLRETMKSYSVAFQYMKDLWQKLPMPFSRENQIAVESYVLYGLMKMHVSDRGLNIEEIDSVLKTVTREGESIDPAVISAFAEVVVQMTRWLNQKDRDTKPFFNLK